MIGSVMFPSLSLINDELDKVKYLYLKINRFMASLIFPLMGILCINAPQVVSLLVGQQWLPIVPVVQILSGVAAIKSINLLNNSIFISQGRTDIDFYVNTLSGTFMVLCFFIGVQFGINQVAIAYLLGIIIILVPSWFVAGKLVKCNLNSILKNVLPQIIITAVLTFLGLIFNRYFNLELSNLILIILKSSVFTILWLALIALLNRTHFNELLNTRKEFLKK
jgi:PST family polysaccharide transporter